MTLTLNQTGLQIFKQLEVR